jgi:glycosyltransferase involved in cell wall biosynthesis
MNPRVLFVSHTRYDVPLSPSLAKKWDALSEVLDVRVIGAAGRHVTNKDPRIRPLRMPAPPIMHGVAYHAALPFAVAAELRTFAPDVVVAQSPYAAFCALPALLVRNDRPKLIVEIHGDWRTAARLYGSRFRNVYAPLSDRAAAFALRRSDATRALSAYTARLAEEATGQPPLAVFPTYTDIETYLEEPVKPVPENPVALWVGVLERYKNADGLDRIWRLVADCLPSAKLTVIGKGTFQRRLQRLAADFPGRVELISQLPPREVATRMDSATLLFLPSRSEGLGRVVIEAFTRGRPVVAAATGGIRDVVVPGRNGMLRSPDDERGFAAALVEVLGDRELAQRLGEQARLDAEPLWWPPQRYAAAMRQLVDRVLPS